MERELIRRFLHRYRRFAWIVVAASILINVFVFAGSAYMMLVYDSVLPSRSEPTLLGLFVLLAVVYLVQGSLEAIRSEALLSIANGVHEDLLGPVHHAAVSSTLQSQRETSGLQLMRDLDQIHTYLTSMGPVAIIDLPWILLFLVVLTSLHWALGLTALLGSLVLAAIGWWAGRRTAAGTKELAELSGRRLAANQRELRFAETALAMGMQERLLARARQWDASFLANQSFLSRTVSRLGGAGRLFRLFLQSTMLTVGALLVLDGKASVGIMLAASILSGRALAPVDQALANARAFSAARAGWRRIIDAIAIHSRDPAKSVSLPLPNGSISVHDLWVVPPGSQTAAVCGISFRLEKGQALAIIGASAAGKSTLAKALLGVWRPAHGEIRLDGATHDQWNSEVLGTGFGYVPQTVELLEGTIGQNICRFDPNASSDAIVAAAREAGMHESVLTFPHGYETRLSPMGNELSAGQRQRIALARALYGKPFILILDEPNSNLDAAGDAALEQVIIGVRERGGIVVMVTHRRATLAPVSHVALMAAGKLVDFGERDSVLQRSPQVIAEGAGLLQAKAKLENVRR